MSPLLIAPLNRIERSAKVRAWKEIGSERRAAVSRAKCAKRAWRRGRRAAASDGAHKKGRRLRRPFCKLANQLPK